MTGQPSVVEVLTEHAAKPLGCDQRFVFLPECRCGWLGTSSLAWAVDHGRHVAEALAAAGASLWSDMARATADYAEIPEYLRPVITVRPSGPTRESEAEHAAMCDRDEAHERRVRAEAWDEGFQVGWEHCQDGNYGTDYWDDDVNNPYRTTETKEDDRG